MLIKALQKFIFVDCCFFSYFYGSDEESLNPQESIHEKTHLTTMHLQEWILIYQVNIEYFCGTQLSCFSYFQNFERMYFDQWKPNLQYLWKYFAGRHFKAYVQRLITVRIFHGVNRFQKNNYMKKGTYIKKSREFSRIFDHIQNILWLHPITDENSYRDTAWMLPWHYANTTLLWKYYKYVSTKVLKIDM